MGGVETLIAVPQCARVDLLTDLRRRRVQLDFEETILLAAMAADPDPYRDDRSITVDRSVDIEMDREWVREEIACALHVAPVTAAAKLSDASALVTRFPAALAAMGDGVLPGFYATRLVDACVGLSLEQCAQVEARVLPRVADQTVGQFSAAVRRAVLAIDTRSAQVKQAQGRADRRVVFSPVRDDDTVTLWALLPADQAAELEARITALAASWKGLDDGRSGDQRRADALCSLGTPHPTDSTATSPHNTDSIGAHNTDSVGNTDGVGSAGGVGSADGVGSAGGTGGSATTVLVGRSVNVTVALSTLLGLDDQPGELDGEPVSAILARAMASHASARWRWLLTDHTGRLCDVIETGYRPSTALARFVQLRDLTCQFPGCRRRATRCDLDHRTPWSTGGPTTAANLHCLCARHHKLKHHAGWHVTRLPDGTTVWTDPTGHTYRQPPPEQPGQPPPGTVAA